MPLFVVEVSAGFVSGGGTIELTGGVEKRFIGKTLSFVPTILVLLPLDCLFYNELLNYIHLL